MYLLQKIAAILIAISLTANAAAQTAIVDSRASDTTGAWADLMRMQAQRYFPVADLCKAYSELTLVQVDYISMDKRLHTGVIMVHRDLAADVTAIFADMLRDSFPIRAVFPACRFPVKADGDGWDDEAVMQANATSSFNFRYKTNGTELSLHALGRAIDLNPDFNPYEAYYDGGKLIHPKGSFYDTNRPGTITDNNIVKYFEVRGWVWAGRWGNPVDYQHFQKTTTKPANKLLLVKHNSLKDLFYTNDTLSLVFDSSEHKELYINKKIIDTATLVLHKKDYAKLSVLLHYYTNKKVAAALQQSQTNGFDYKILAKKNIDTTIFALHNTVIAGIKNKRIAIRGFHTSKSGTKIKAIIDGIKANLERDGATVYIANNADSINTFKPDLTIIVGIDYYKNTADTAIKVNQFAVVAGAFTENGLDSTASRLNFMRLLVTDDLTRSVSFAKTLLTAFQPVAPTINNYNTFLAYKNNNITQNGIGTNTNGIYHYNIKHINDINGVAVAGCTILANKSAEAKNLKEDKDLPNNDLIKKIVTAYCAAAKMYFVE